MARPRKYPDPVEWPNKLDEKSILIVLGYRQPKALTRMLEEGLPRREDGYYDLTQIVPWILHRASTPADELSLKAAKTEQEIQKIKLEIQRREMDLSVARAESMPRTEHRDILTEQARYWVATTRRECDEFAPSVVGIESITTAAQAMTDLWRAIVTRISAGPATDTTEPETPTIEAVEEKPVDSRTEKRVRRGYQTASADIGFLL